MRMTSARCSHFDQPPASRRGILAYYQGRRCVTLSMENEERREVQLEQGVPVENQHQLAVEPAFHLLDPTSGA